MDDQQSNLELVQQYKTSLKDLTFNSKPMISCLTILAEESKILCEEIVKLIEQRIYEVPSDKKLPLLYLMDSICKNIGEKYTNLFSINIIRNFCHVFEKGDEKIRQNLYKLRSTWSEIFTQHILYEIDVKIKSNLDPAWPITAILPTNDKITNPVHVNPKFLSESRTIREAENDVDLRTKPTHPELPLINSELSNDKVKTELEKTVKKRLQARRSPSPIERKRRSPNWLNSNLNNRTSENLSISTLPHSLQTTVDPQILAKASIQNSHINLGLINEENHNGFLVKNSLIHHKMQTISPLSDFSRIPTSQQNVFQPISNCEYMPEELKLVVDGKVRKLYYLDDHTAIVLMNCLIDTPFNKLKLLNPLDLDPRLISFDGQPTTVYIDEKDVILLNFDNQWKSFYHNGIEQRIKFGGPGREIYLNDQILQATFGGPPVKCKFLGDSNDHTITLSLPPPRVRLSEKSRVDLWINLLQKCISDNKSNITSNIVSQVSILNSVTQPNLSVVASNINEVPNINTLPLQTSSIQSINTNQLPVSVPVPIIGQHIFNNSSSLIPTIDNFSLNQLNVNDLFNKLQAVGMIPQNELSVQSNQILSQLPQNQNMLLNKNGNLVNKKSSVSPPPTELIDDACSNLSNKSFKNDFNSDLIINNNSNNKCEINVTNKKQEEPLLELDAKVLKIKRTSIIDSLYNGLQCTNCSLRFNIDENNEKGKSKYSKHLDWHFRQNRKGRSKPSNSNSSNLKRNWYYPLNLWLQFKEITNEDSSSQFISNSLFDNKNNELNEDALEEKPIALIKANADESLNVCFSCYEKFNQVWCEEEEEWRLENAVLHDDDKYYHPMCLSDKTDESKNFDETLVCINENILDTIKTENVLPADLDQTNKEIEINSIEEKLTDNKKDIDIDIKIKCEDKGIFDNQIDNHESKIIVNEKTNKELNKESTTKVDLENNKNENTDNKEIIDDEIYNVTLAKEEDNIDTKYCETNLEDNEFNLGSENDKTNTKKEFCLNNSENQIVIKHELIEMNKPVENKQLVCNKLDENVKIDFEESEIKVEIIGLNLPIIDNENVNKELTKNVSNETIIKTEDHNEFVRKIEFNASIKKDSKPILLKLNIKDPELNMMSITNQRNAKNDSPNRISELDNKKESILTQNSLNDYNKEENVYFKGKEESALCNIM